MVRRARSHAERQRTRLPAPTPTPDSAISRLRQDEESIDVHCTTSDAVDGDVGSSRRGHFANVARVRSNHRMVPANGSLDN